MPHTEDSEKTAVLLDPGLGGKYLITVKAEVENWILNNNKTKHNMTAVRIKESSHTLQSSVNHTHLLKACLTEVSKEVSSAQLHSSPLHRS